ncbi:Cullin [Suillus lakei]|nr:Cullin [Suillus lakei]
MSSSNASADITSHHPSLPAIAGFETTWAFIEQRMDHIMTTDEVSLDDRMSLYMTVYNYTSTHSPCGGSSSRGAFFVGCPEIDRNVFEYFINRVKLLKDQCDNLQDEALLRHYASAWNKYSTGANIINQILSNTKSYSGVQEQDESRRVFSVRTMALDRWKGILVFHLHKTIPSIVLQLINRQRDGETIDQSLVKTVVDSFVFLGIDVYEADLEMPFLNETMKYYEPESQLFLSRGNLFDYLKKVGQCLKEEEERVDQYLNSGTWNKLLNKCEYMLVRPHSHLIWETFQRSLDLEKEEDLQLMYTSLFRTLKCLEPLRKKFEEHVKKAGPAAVVLCDKSEGKDSLDPGPYVDTLLQVHRKYSGFVTRVFGGEAGFVASFDKACREFVNRNAITGSSTTKSPELLAEHADALLRKNNKMTERDLKAALSHTMVLFKYIEDKDVFQTFYATKLSKRLFHGISVSDESEASMISKLREACGFEYTHKLQKMFTDISLSKNLTDEFNERMQNPDDTNINFSIMVLSSKCWPLRAPTNNFIIPPEILRVCNRFFRYFQTKHSGRRLTWLWDHSSNELGTN